MTSLILILFSLLMKSQEKLNQNLPYFLDKG